MLFEQGNLYHIYNQGNNKQKIFFIEDNYIFFLNKIKTHILPYADVLAWCLMPNHFHLMALVKEEGLNTSDPMTSGHQITKTRTLNNSIAIMLRSYTRAINKQNGTSGSLFRQKTKAECLNCPKGIKPSFINKNGITRINISNPEREYPHVCFNYIHLNPVKANLVKKETEWEYSSAKDYAGLRNGKLVNKLIAKKYVILES
jgi:putative transposase